MLARTFSVNVQPAAIAPIASSVGAHLAAKLAVFDSDERVLTDELCDMFITWARATSSANGVPLALTKVTQPLEAKIGADLEILVASPRGMKRVLAQAKVIDVRHQRLRGDGRQVNRLRKQLVKARKQSSTIAFLLAFLPGHDLDGSHHGFLTWEQSYRVGVAGRPSSRLGATFVHADTLLTAKGRWQENPPFVYSRGVFAPAGVSFGELLLRLLICDVGSWTSIDDRTRAILSAETNEEALIAYRTFGIDFTALSGERWADLLDVVGAALAGLREPREGGTA